MSQQSSVGGDPEHVPSDGGGGEGGDGGVGGGEGGGEGGGVAAHLTAPIGRTSGAASRQEGEACGARVSSSARHHSLHARRVAGTSANASRANGRGGDCGDGGGSRGAGSGADGSGAGSSGGGAGGSGAGSAGGGAGSSGASGSKSGAANPIRDPHILMLRPTLEASRARFLAGYPITEVELDALSEQSAERAAVDKAEVDELRRRRERDGDATLCSEERERIVKSDAEKARIAKLAQSMAAGWSFMETDKQFDPFGRWSSYG